MRSVHYRKGDDRCGRCGCELLRVILVPNPEFHHHLLPLCGQCATPEELAYADTTGDCPGCGIPMQFSRRDGYTTRWVACSTRCYHRAWRSSHRMKTRTCEVCRRGFQSTRRDARFCSSACRQKHHRAGGDPPPPPGERVFDESGAPLLTPPATPP